MQVPAQFEYQRATSVEHAIALLNRHGPESRVVAGGHSLIPMMKLRLAQPEMLIDINDLTELAEIHFQEGVLRLGAMLRHADLLASPEVGLLCPMLHDAERVIADPVVRNRGTVGGSVCQADPSEDLSGAFCALRAVAVIRGCPNGGEAYTRTVPDARVLHRPLPDGGCGRRATGGAAGADLPGRRQRLRQGRPPVGGLGGRRRGGGGVARRRGTVTEVGIGLTAVGARNFVAQEAEEYLRGRAASPSTSRRRVGSPPSTARRPTTSAARPTTSGTWPAS